MKFENARIIKKQASATEYRQQEYPRGHPGYRIGRSDLCEIARCPHRWYAGSEDDDTPATQWGTLIDAMLLAGELGIAVTPETYEAADGQQKPWNWNAKTCQQWRVANEGRIIVKPDLMTDAEHAIKKIRADTVISAILKDADFQVWVEADYRHSDKITVPLKGLIDIVPANTEALVDFKTTQSAEHRQYSRTIFNFGYHVQAALYLDLFNALKQGKRDTFLHIVQESSPPYEVGRRMLDNNWLQLGRAQYQAALELYGQCLETNTWPSYDDMEAPGIMRVNGWTMTSPEAWMILTSDAKLDNADGILG